MSGKSGQEMFLYKFEAVLQDESLLTIVVTASSDESAFGFAENQVTGHLAAAAEPREITLVQKKLLARGGVGYVIETSRFN